MNNLMRRSGIIAVLCLLLCLCLLVCSCGGNGGKDETTPAETDPVTNPIDDVTTADPDDVTTEDPGDATSALEVEKVTYTVTVKNEAGEALANVNVQLCSTTCTPAVTNASGVATFELPEDVYEVKIIGTVEGYVTEEKYNFAAGTTSLEIVLKAAAPVPTEGAINLKTDEDAVKDYDYLEGDLLYFNGYIVGDMDATSPEDALVEVTAGDSVVYTYEATADGYVVVYVFKSLGAKTTVTNITTGTQLLPLSGIGLNMVPVTAGNTYEVKVDYTLTEEVLYIVAGAAAPDGSKDAPYYLATGTVAKDVVVPEGETVWFYYNDNYLLIEDATVKVNVNGVLYAPDANGEIDNALLGLESYSGALIGISSSEADDKVTVKLTGSDPAHPLTVRGTDSYMYMECNAPAWTTVYMSFPTGYAAVIEDAPAKVGFVNGNTVVHKIYTTAATSLLTLYNGTDTDTTVGFGMTYVVGTDGITVDAPISVYESEMYVYEMDGYMTGINPEWDKTITVDLEAEDYELFFNEAGETVVYYAVTLPYGEWNVAATVNGNNVVAFQYIQGMAGMSYDFEATENGFTTYTANGGQLVLAVVVKDANCKLEVAVSEVPPTPGSAELPLDLVFTEGVANLTITKEMVDEIGASGHAGYVTYYSYAATEACTLTVAPLAQIEGAEMWDQNNVDCPYGITVPGSEYPAYSYDYDTDGNFVITLNAGESVVIGVCYGTAQYNAGTDLAVNVTYTANVVEETPVA